MRVPRVFVLAAFSMIVHAKDDCMIYCMIVHDRSILVLFVNFYLAKCREPLRGDCLANTN